MSNSDGPGSLFQEMADEIAARDAEIARLREVATLEITLADAFRVALNNVSGALVDSGIEFRDDYSRYGEAVRKLVDQRADARNKADHLQAIACPGCGGPTTHDRELPPNPYLCLKCAAKQIAEDMEDPEPCETCGGSRRIDGEFTREDGTKQGWFDHCPDCTPDTVDFAHGSDPEEAIASAELAMGEDEDEEVGRMCASCEEVPVSSAEDLCEDCVEEVDRD